MIFFFTAFASVTLVPGIAAARNVHNTNIRDIVVSPEPCAVVSSSSSSFYAANPTPTTSLQIPAAIAYACQLSAPFNQELSLALIEYIVPYINFQSSIAYLKNPPSTYQMPAVDILGGLEEIRKNASSGLYASQYAFDAAVTNLVLEAHDAHFIYVSALLSTFRYFNDLPLISISVDGLSLPNVYIGYFNTGANSLFEDQANYDFRAAEYLGYLQNHSSEPSPIVTINGIDIPDFFLHKRGNNQKGDEMSYQDPDAAYNSMFYSLREFAGSQGAGLGFFATAGLVTAPVDIYSLTFQNGTSFDVTNFATPTISFKNISAGAELFAAVESNQTVEGLQTTTSTAAIDLANGYPEPFIKHSEGLVAGYFLNTTGYIDTAVLALFTFSPATLQSGQEYQSVVQTFLDASTKEGKTKLIIDLSGNPGGEPALATDVFKQLFPQINPYHAARLRATEELNFIGSRLAQVPYDNATYELINYEALETSNYTNFASWSQVFGPFEFYGDNFTSLVQSNFSDPIQTIDGDGFVVTGYLNRSQGFTQPFTEDNMVVIYDGDCASACAHFSELMKVQTQVPSVVFGGRPQYGQMQAVGSVRGFDVIEFSEIKSITTGSLEIAKLYNISVPETLTLPSTGDSPLKVSLASINSGNIIRLGDETNTPTEFLYDAADCRLFWTAENLIDVTTVWQRAAVYRWGNDACVQDSTGNTTTSGGSGSSNGGKGLTCNPFSTVLLGVAFSICLLF